MKKNRAYYQKLFQDYPDLVTQAQLRQMLNGISISFSSRLIHEKRVQSLFIRPSYYIVKDSVIDYVLSADYDQRNLKARV